MENKTVQFHVSLYLYLYVMHSVLQSSSCSATQALFSNSLSFPVDVGPVEFSRFPYSFICSSTLFAYWPLIINRVSVMTV